MVCSTQIWKNVLAQKRILYYSPPPVVSLTHHGMLDSKTSARLFLPHAFLPVLSTCTLAASFLPQHEIPTNPAFYINLNDISYFSPLPHYVACTTDSVILSKPQYYDLFLDHGVPVAGGPPIGGLGSNIAPPPRYFLTDLDRTRYRELRRIINETAREGETKPKKAFGGASASDSRTRLVVEATDDVSQADSGFSEGRQPDEAERERIERADHAMALEMERLTDTRIAKWV